MSVQVCVSYWSKSSYGDTLSLATNFYLFLIRKLLIWNKALDYNFVDFFDRIKGHIRINAESLFLWKRDELFVLFVFNLHILFKDILLN
ncbi:hypothetical protein BpHYR1_028266 [Brachionus plicatilis]|uniref:Uncharacterized protein n=1 Tax=Brachionus plicatilis TaxID=10195 RepID=A0A3M7PXV3_BRAPC|nr:hypothetical protein BpHYR1_028266 [Brachionus plicatilis]